MGFEPLDELTSAANSLISQTAKISSVASETTIISKPVQSILNATNIISTLESKVDAPPRHTSTTPITSTAPSTTDPSAPTESTSTSRAVSIIHAVPIPLALSSSHSVSSPQTSSTDSTASAISSSASASSIASDSITTSASSTTSTTSTTVASLTSSTSSESTTSSSLVTSARSTSTHLLVQTSFVPPTTPLSITISTAVASNKSNIGAIAGGAGGGVAGLIILSLLIFFLIRRARKRRDLANFDIANFDPLEFHTGKETSSREDLIEGLKPRPSRARTQRSLVPSLMPTPAFEPAYNHDNRRQSEYEELNNAGVGSHGSPPDGFYNGAKSPPIHLQPPPLSLPPYTEQQDLGRLVVRNESPPAENYVVTSESPIQVVPRATPILEGRSGRSHLPSNPKALLQSRAEKRFENPFADPSSEPPSSLRPGFTNVRKGAHTLNSIDEDVYEGIS